MYLEELIEVALGLILIYTVTSVAVMSIQEWIVSALGKRSKDLEKTLRFMLAESLKPTSKASGEVTAEPEHASGIFPKLYNHPMVKSLYLTGSKPSYIPADKFVLALFDIVITAGTEASVVQKALTQLKTYREQVDGVARDAFDKGIVLLINKAKDVRDDPIQMAKLRKEIETFTSEFTDFEIGPIFEALIHAQLPIEEPEIIAALKRGAATLTVDNTQLKATLDDLVYQAEAFLVKGESKLAAARMNGEKWFNDTMDRASGWYKRTMQYWALIIGLVLAVIFNIDTVEIGTRLWIQPALRQSLVKVAETYQLEASSETPGEPINPVESINRLQSSLVGLNLPIGWNLIALGPDQFDSAVDTCTLSPQPKTDGAAGKDVYGLPINGACRQLTNFPKGWGFLGKFIGFFVTGVAAMQGAPFWFEILKKIVNVRSSGVKPEEKDKK
jgi:hypothetical protein